MYVYLSTFYLSVSKELPDGKTDDNISPLFTKKKLIEESQPISENIFITAMPNIYLIISLDKVNIHRPTSPIRQIFTLCEKHGNILYNIKTSSQIN